MQNTDISEQYEASDRLITVSFNLSPVLKKQKSEKRAFDLLYPYENVTSHSTWPSRLNTKLAPGTTVELDHQAQVEICWRFTNFHGVSSANDDCTEKTFSQSRFHRFKGGCFKLLPTSMIVDFNFLGNSKHIFSFRRENCRRRFWTMMRSSKLDAFTFQIFSWTLLHAGKQNCLKYKQSSKGKNCHRFSPPSLSMYRYKA